MRSQSYFALGLGLMILTWSVMIGASFYRIMAYETTPAKVEAAPPHWPANGPLNCEHGRTNLVLAVHPHCPCTRATIDELTQLMAQESDKLVGHVLVYKPRLAPDGWERTDLWRRVAAIPGIDVRCDEEGTQAKQFGAVSSGHCLLYDANGRLVFSGGLTNARGHAGESIGRHIIVDFLRNQVAHETEIPVYGCPLFDPEPRPTERCEQCAE